MKTNKLNLFAGICSVVAVLAVQAAAQPFDLTWHTIDGGGLTFSTGGTFSLGGTIGQADAGSFTTPMAGGSFQLVGGFWSGAAICTCPGDLNGDTSKNGLDVQQFVACLIGGGGCSCADIDGSGSTTAADVDNFVALLLAGSGCP